MISWPISSLHPAHEMGLVLKLAFEVRGQLKTLLKVLVRLLQFASSKPRECTVHIRHC